MTRGALTTFSIANDVAKYFAIVPALFVAAIPSLAVLNIMHLATWRSAILSAVIFNAIVIPLLIPIALRGVGSDLPAPARSCGETSSSTGWAGSSRPSSASSSSTCASAHWGSYETRRLRDARQRDGRAAALLVTIVLCAISYPLILLGLGKAFFHDQAEGGLVEVNGQVVGSRLVARDFPEVRYLWPRPSAADFDATAASGSNLAASNPALRTRIVHELGVLHASDDERVPADLVTASGSGLDPHVTLAGALYQAPRIAAARGVEAALFAQSSRTWPPHEARRAAARQCPRGQPPAQSRAARPADPMSDDRPHPEDFLDLVRRSREGRLKVFLGPAAGVGKTYRMLQRRASSPDAASTSCSA